MGRFAPILRGFCRLAKTWTNLGLQGYDKMGSINRKNVGKYTIYGKLVD